MEKQSDTPEQKISVSENTSHLEPKSPNKNMKFFIIGIVSLLVLSTVGFVAYYLGAQNSSTDTKLVGVSPSQSISPTPTAAITTSCTSDDPSFCTVSEQITQIIETKDFSKLPDFMEIQTVTCPAEDAAALIPEICQGKPNTQQSGYRIGNYYSEGSLYQKADFVQNVQSYILQQSPTFRGVTSQGDKGAIVFLNSKNPEMMFTVFLKKANGSWKSRYILEGGIMASPQDDNYRNVEPSILEMVQ